MRCSFTQNPISPEKTKTAGLFAPLPVYLFPFFAPKGPGQGGGGIINVRQPQSGEAQDERRPRRLHSQAAPGEAPEGDARPRCLFQQRPFLPSREGQEKMQSLTRAGDDGLRQLP